MARDDILTMTDEELHAAYYNGNPLQTRSETDELREEIRRRVDAVSTRTPNNRRDTDE